eukprot:UN05449
MFKALLATLEIFSFIPHNAYNIYCRGKDKCKDKTKTCRADEECNVYCIEESACSGNAEINGEDATTVTVYCRKKDACKDASILCGSDICYVGCFGESACSGNTEIDGHDASILRVCCDGKDACKDANIHPSYSCPT